MELKSNGLLFSNKQENIQNNLSLGKRTVTELTESEMVDVDGGTTLLCVTLATILILTPLGAD